MSDFSKKLEALRDQLRRVIDREHAYPYRAERPGTPASVLLLLSAGDPRIGDMDSVEFLITRRTDQLETHKGQYALPGGMRDPEDLSGIETALRENEEEMGIPRDLIEPLGEFPPLWTPSGFLVTPVVGVLREPRGKVVVNPNEAEIDLWFWCAVSQLADPAIYRQEMREIILDGKKIQVPTDVFQVDTHRIWGVTGAILRNFLERWKLSDQESSANLTRI